MYYRNDVYVLLVFFFFLQGKEGTGVPLFFGGLGGVKKRTDGRGYGGGGKGGGGGLPLLPVVLLPPISLALTPVAYPHLTPPTKRMG